VGLIPTQKFQFFQSKKPTSVESYNSGHEPDNAALMSVVEGRAENICSP